MRKANVLTRCEVSPLPFSQCRAEALACGKIPAVEAISQAFCQLYLDSGAWARATWLGTQILKCPLDLWIYQEILCRTRPDVIVETGTWSGGSALYLASICDLLGTGRVITIDIEARPGRPQHPRVTYVTGSSVDAQVVGRIRGEIGAEESTMVVLDSDHSREHVLAELRAYAPLVGDGCYMIVEDTAAAEVARPIPGSDPLGGVREFLAENPAFAADEDCEKFLMTWNPGGYLRRIGAAHVANR